MRISLKILKFLAELVILLVAGFIMLYFTYYFGWSLLPGARNWGNDIPSALNNVYYLERWFPPIPKWIYIWAGGVPFLQNYPPLPTYLTFFLHKFSGLTIDQMSKLLLFFSIPATALGVVALARLITKNWWVGILAGVIMILQPDSWFWLTFGGFYALSVSVVFFTWSLFFFWLALEKNRFFFWILASLIYGLTWLAHPTAAVLSAIAMIFLGSGFAIQTEGIKFFWKGLLKSLVVITTGCFLFAFWIIPFYLSRGIGGIGIGAEQMYRDTFRELLGLDFPPGSYVTGTFFSAPAIILFVLGIFAAFWRKSVLRWAILACGLAVFIMTGPYYAMPLVELFQFFWSATTVRSAMILRILGSIIAAYGAASLVRPIFWLIEGWAKKLKENKFWQYSTESISGVVGFLVLLILLKTIFVTPPLGPDSNLFYRGFGPLYNWLVLEKRAEGVFILNPETTQYSISLYPKTEEIIRDFLPTIRSVNPDFGLTELVAKRAAEKTEVTSQERIEIPPVLGGISGALGDFSDVAQIPAYVGESLIQRMIGWQIDCFYYTKFCGSSQIEDLARWYGITQIWTGGDSLTPEMAKMKERLDQISGFVPQRVYLGKIAKADAHWNFYQVENSTSLTSITNKPAILVIGDNPPDSDVFDIVFRGLTKVDFGYQDAWSVKGKQFIDDYKLEELQQFEAVILHGYQYHNRNKAWRLLEQYVNQGGKLFVDTGWQYTSKDWGKIEKGKPVEILMPEILPVEKTIWASIEDGWHLALASHPITEGVGRTDWGKPLWREKPWGAAMAERDWLRSGATALLSNQAQVLVAAWDYGQGKVVWTGFDFWGHLVEYQANDERKFVQNILDWLIGTESWEKKLDFEREKPDLIKINFSSGPGRNKLLFKEVASDNWTAAQLGDKKLPVYKAGPGWRMVFLPDQPSAWEGQVVFSYQRNKIEWLGILTSVLTAILVFSYLVSKLIKKDWDERLLAKIKENLVKKKTKIKESWEDEEQ